MLKEAEFVNIVNNIVEETVAKYQNVCSPQRLWDVCKTRIKTVTSEYGRQKSLKRKCKFKDFESKMTVLHIKSVAISVTPKI